jgi:hypothetical protein
MNWLSGHFWQLFEGVGGAALVGLVFFVLQRFLNTPAEETTATLTAHDAKVSGSPVASGSGIIQNVIHVGQPLPTPTPAPAAISPQPKPRPNMRMTRTGVAYVSERENIWRENEQDADPALIIQFTNEARPGVRNVGAPVQASLVYKDGQAEVERLIGGWVNATSDYTEFRVDESHKLIVGILYGEIFMAVGRRRVEGSAIINIEGSTLPSFQTVNVRLTDANSGDVLYEGEFRVTIDPLQITATYNMQGNVILGRST